MHDQRRIEFNRRQLLAGLTVGFGAALAPIAARRAFATEVAQLGDRKIMTLSDGNLVLPVSFLFPEVPKEELEPMLNANGMSTEQLEPTLNLTLVQDGDRMILFDAGSGPHFMPSAGKLTDAMAEAGVDAEAISDVVFTHGHPDHLWGIVDDFEEIAFPNAQLHFPRKEWEFWRSDDAVANMDEARKAFAVGAQNRLAVMEEQVSLFDAGQEVVSGVEAVDTAGHTPGHTSFVLHGGSGDGLMVVGDALTNHVVSFEKPKWRSGSDQDADLAIETRVKLLDRLAGEEIPIIGYHLPESGLGRVERSGDAYRFVQDS